MAATFAHMSTISPPRLTRQFQLASDPGLHHPPVLCCRETNLLPSLNAFVFSLYERYTLLYDLSSGNLARQGFPISRKTPRPLPSPGNTTPMKNRELAMIASRACSPIDKLTELYRALRVYVNCFQLTEAASPATLAYAARTLTESALAARCHIC